MPHHHPSLRAACGRQGCGWPAVRLLGPPARQAGEDTGGEAAPTESASTSRRCEREGRIDGMGLLRRHVRDDWGDLGEEDRAENDRALVEGLRIFLPTGRRTAQRGYG
jgi:hypothetical protein